MTTLNETAPAPAKTPHARPMTEKRREQNRRSQKVYRDKLKKKLEDLEAQVKTKTQTEDRQDQSIHEIFNQEIHETKDASYSTETDNISNVNVIDLNAAFAAAGDLSFPIDSTLPTISLGIRSRSSNSPSSASSLFDITTPDDVAIPKCLAADLFAPPDPDSPDMRSMWPVPPESHLELYSPPSARERRRPRNTSTQILTSRSSTSSILSPISFHSFSRTSPSNTTPTGIPSPYLNHLQLLGETTFGATLAIAASIGITRTAYVNDHPSPFSPYKNRDPSFFTPPHISFTTIPKPLRPTTQQLTLLHPGYLDCIIFPKFRSNAIVLSSRGELDHHSLFLDLMHDGLVCWGQASGSRGTMGAGAAAPARDMRDTVAWSPRSWEARPWFLRKWSWLLAIDPTILGIGLTKGIGVVVDEEEHDSDGMFEGSRWWRAMRGEEDDVDEKWSSDEIDEPPIHQKQQQQKQRPRVEEPGETISRLGSCNVGLRDFRQFAEMGTLWPTQFQDPMAAKLVGAGLSADFAGDYLAGLQ